MANPSDVNASAVGKEVIRRYYVDALGETPTAVITGIANHVMTVVSIVIAERLILSDAKFNLSIEPDGGSAIFLLTNEPIPNQKTFIFNDRIAITGTDVLKIEAISASSTAALDVWATYIDQEFAAP